MARNLVSRPATRTNEPTAETTTAPNTKPETTNADRRNLRLGQVGRTGTRADSVRFTNGHRCPATFLRRASVICVPTRVVVIGGLYRVGPERNQTNGVEFDLSNPTRSAIDILRSNTSLGICTDVFAVEHIRVRKLLFRNAVQSHYRSGLTGFEPATFEVPVESGKMGRNHKNTYQDCSDLFFFFRGGRVYKVSRNVRRATEHVVVMRGPMAMSGRARSRNLSRTLT